MRQKRLRPRSSGIAAAIHLRHLAATTRRRGAENLAHDFATFQNTGTGPFKCPDTPFRHAADWR